MYLLWLDAEPGYMGDEIFRHMNLKHIKKQIVYEENSFAICFYHYTTACLAVFFNFISTSPSKTSPTIQQAIIIPTTPFHPLVS